MKEKAFLFAVIISGIIFGVFTFLNHDAPPESSTINIDEDMDFDYLCLDTEFNKKSDTSDDSFCGTEGTSIWMDLGLSYYMNENSDNNDLRILALKITVPEIQDSDYLFQTSISKADLILNTRYLVEDSYDEKTTEFSVSHFFCDDTLWLETNPEHRLMCVTEYNTITTKPKILFGSFVADDNKPITLNVVSHIEEAKKSKMSQFTELVTFYPDSVIDSNILGNKIWKCLENVEETYKRRDCVRQYQIEILSSEFQDYEHLRPKVELEIDHGPTLLTTSIHTISFVTFPVFAGIYASYVIRDKRKVVRPQKEIENEKIKKDETVKGKEEVNPILAIKYLWAFYLGIGLLFAFIAFAVNFWVNSPSNDIFNLTTLTLEIGFGIMIAWTVYVYSKKWDRENKKVVKEVQKVLGKQVEQSKTRTEIAESTISIEIDFLAESLQKIWKEKNLSDDEKKKRVGVLGTPELTNLVQNFMSSLGNIIKELENFLNVYSFDLRPATLNELIPLIKDLKDYNSSPLRMDLSIASIADIIIILKGFAKTLNSKALAKSLDEYFPDVVFKTSKDYNKNENLEK